MKISKVLMAILFTVSAYAADVEDQISKLRAEFESKLNALQAEQAITGKKLDAFDSSIDKLESKAALDKMNFSPYLRLRVDKYNYSNDGIDGVNWISPASQAAQENYDKSYAPALSATFGLNMNYKLNENLKFVGQLEIQRNDQTKDQGRICKLHSTVGQSGSTATTIEPIRAYIDYTPNPTSDVPMTYSVGILPTSGGSSSNLAENLPRASMFPSLAFDMNTYGGIITANLDKVLGHNFYLRAVLAEAYTPDKNAFYYQCNRMILKGAKVAGLFAEMQLPYIDDNTFQFGVNYLGAINATPFTGSPTFLDSDKPKSLGDMINVVANLEARNIQDMPLTAFISGAISIPHPNGNVVDYRTSVAALGSSGLDYAYGPMYDNNGWAIHTGAQYQLQETQTKIGVEYNHGSKYWFSGTQGARDVFNKLANRGDTYEAYVIQPVSDQIWVKAGYLYSKESFTGSGWHFSEPMKKDGTEKNIYASVNVAF